MKKVGILSILVLLSLFSRAQENNYNWAFGFYGDVQAKTNGQHSFGMQAKYNVDKHSAFQAQVFGRKNFVGIGADYLFLIKDRTKSDFNIFVGPGIEQNFYWSTEDDGILRPEPKSSYFNVAGQAGASYYFRPVQLSIYAAYKVKYDFSNEEVSPNFISLGVRYHLW